MENKHITKLPADDAVQNWFEENIDKECSASSAVYKFRLWLESLQTGHPRIGWVKCSERLPGYKKRVKWRDGNDHSYATDGEISLFEMDKPNLEGWEWLDESAAGREEVDPQELWDEHAEYIDDNIDELVRWAGSTVITWEQFNKMMAKFKQQKS